MWSSIKSETLWNFVSAWPIIRVLSITLPGSSRLSARTTVRSRSSSMMLRRRELELEKSNPILRGNCKNYTSVIMSTTHWVAKLHFELVQESKIQIISVKHSLVSFLQILPIENSVWEALLNSCFSNSWPSLLGVHTCELQVCVHCTLGVHTVDFADELQSYFYLSRMSSFCFIEWSSFVYISFALIRKPDFSLIWVVFISICQLIPVRLISSTSSVQLSQLSFVGIFKENQGGFIYLIKLSFVSLIRLIQLNINKCSVLISNGFVC